MDVQLRLGLDRSHCTHHVRLIRVVSQSHDLRSSCLSGVVRVTDESRLRVKDTV